MLNNQWTVGRKLWLLNGFLMFVLLVVGVIAYKNTANLSNDISHLGSTDIVAVREMTLTDMMHDGIRAVVLRGLLAAQEKDNAAIEEVVKEYGEFTENIHNSMAALDKLELGENAAKGISEAKPDVESYVKMGQVMVDLIKEGKMSEAKAQLPGFQESFTKLEGSLEKLGEEIENTAKDSVKESISHASSALNILLLTVSIGLLVAFAFAFVVNKSLITSLKNILGLLTSQTHQLGGSASSISETSKQLSSTAVDQAAAVQETAASLEEINSMVSKTSDNSNRLSETVEHSSRSVREGQEAVQQMLEAMTLISQSSNEVMGQIQESNQQIMEIVKVIGEIGEKTKVINDIVFQTKLLSFNASVEAARAGEHGKGFAVVAEEVGNLAQMSGNAAKEISTMLESGIHKANSIVNDSKEKLARLMSTSNEKVEKGKEVASVCGSALGEIVNQVNDVSQMTTEITAAIKEQTQGLSEINKAVQLFDKSTQENSQVSTSAANTAGNLLAQFQALESVIGDLRMLIGGGDVPSHTNSLPATSEVQHREPAVSDQESTSEKNVA